MPGEPVPDPPPVPDGAALRAALARTRVNIALLAATYLALLGGVAYLVFGVDYRDTVKPERYADAFRRQFAGDIDDVVADAAQLAAEAAPEAADAMAAQLRADAPAYAHALTTEGDVLADHLAGELRTKANARAARIADRYRAVLRAELREETDPQVYERVGRDFQRLLGALGERYYVGDFRTTLQETRAAWKAVPPAEEKPGDPPVRDRLAAAASDWVRAKLIEDLTAGFTRPRKPRGTP